jgi:hypothetical protein
MNAFFENNELLTFNTSNLTQGYSNYVWNDSFLWRT